jgi:hypothetical protein
LAGSHSAFRPGFRQVTIGRVITLSTKKVSKKKLVKKMGQVIGYPKNGWTQDGFSWFLPGQVSCFSYGWLRIPCKILQTSRILQRVTYVSQEIQVLKYRSSLFAG